MNPFDIRQKLGSIVDTTSEVDFTISKIATQTFSAVDDDSSEMTISTSPASNWAIADLSWSSGNIFEVADVRLRYHDQPIDHV